MVEPTTKAKSALDSVDHFESHWTSAITPGLIILLVLSLIALVYRRQTMTGYWITLGIAMSFILLWREFTLREIYGHIPINRSIDPIETATELVSIHQQTFTRICAILVAILAGAVVSKIRFTQETGKAYKERRK